MIYFLLLFQSALGTIINFSQWMALADGSFSCSNGIQKTKIVSFPDSFDTIPQVFIIVTKLDYYSSSEFKIRIESITTTGFTIKYECIGERIWSLYVNVFAFSEKRLQVFNNFNMENPTDVIFTKSDSNQVNAYISILSLGMTGPLDFNLQIIDLNPYEFKVALVQDPARAANLKQIGYQVIVGTEESLKLYQKYTCTSTCTSAMNTKSTYLQYLFALQGFRYEYTDSIRLEFSYLTSGQNEYYRLQQISGLYTQNINQPGHYKFDGFTTQPSEYSCFTLRISRKEILNLDQQSQILINIIDMNKSFNALGTFIQDINKQISPLQILFQFKCIQGKKIKAQFNKCSTCVGLSKSYNQNQVCYNNKQIISFYPKYNTDAFYKGNLRILIENSKITITQLLYDRQVVIAMIEYLDQ